jgi:hypothetical protein
MLVNYHKMFDPASLIIIEYISIITIYINADCAYDRILLKWRSPGLWNEDEISSIWLMILSQAAVLPKAIHVFPRNLHMNPCV